MVTVFASMPREVKSPVFAVILGNNGITMPFFRQTAYQKQPPDSPGVK